MTQNIEDRFENKQITSAVFVDLTVAYDTVNHRVLLGWSMFYQLLKVLSLTPSSCVIS